MNAGEVSLDGTQEAVWGGAQGRLDRSRTKNGAFARGGADVMGGMREDSRPKLVPGVMLTLSALGAEAIMELTEEVR